MTGIDHFNLRAFDLNLLLAFDALMQEHSVTRAATRLRIGQPAMSHALSNLRVLMGDDLFVRRGQAMLPTPRAQALAGPVRSLLQQAQAVLLRPTPFDPARETRTIRIGVSSEVEFLLLPQLLARLRKMAPGMRVLVRATSRAAVGAHLDDGTVDLGVGCFEKAASWHVRRPVYEETHVCCFDAGLTGWHAPVTAEDYVERPHILVSLQDGLFGCLEDALDRASVQLNVVAATPHFLTALTMATQAPVLTTLPRRVAEHWAPVLRLALSPLPLELETFSVGLLWHTRTQGDAAAEWLRSQVVATLLERQPTIIRDALP